MVLAIISFAIEFILLTVLGALGNLLTQEFAIFSIVAFVICTIVSIACIIYNSIRLKDPFISKGVTVTGLVFSIVGSVIGSIFVISCFATLAALL